MVGFSALERRRVDGRPRFRFDGKIIRWRKTETRTGANPEFVARYADSAVVVRNSLARERACEITAGRASKETTTS